jgi:hypothetical protein
VEVGGVVRPSGDGEGGMGRRIRTIFTTCFVMTYASTLLEEHYHLCRDQDAI